jgi:hypothetical protein
MYMIKRAMCAAAVAFAASGIWSPATLADSADAMCEVRKDGDTKKGASGPCGFSQRQGYIDLDLRNGDTYSLAPGNKPDHFKDQKGNKVVRSIGAGGVEEFKWEGGKKIIVTFTSSPAASRPAQPSYVSGQTAPDLADLVGAKGGQAEGELERRGYVYAKGSTSGNAKYSSWYSASTGRCVMIRTEEGRYQSIVQAPPSDCGR